MSEIRGLLERRAEAIAPSPESFAKVLAMVRRRRRQRLAAIITSVAVIAGGLAGTAVVVRREPARSVLVTAQLAGTRQTLEIRTELGIRGETKGAPPAVIVPTKGGGGDGLALVRVDTGKSTALPATSGAADGSVMMVQLVTSRLEL